MKKVARGDYFPTYLWRMEHSHYCSLVGNITVLEVENVAANISSLIDFNGMLTCLELFYVLGFGTRVNCTFKFTIFV